MILVKKGFIAQHSLFDDAMSIIDNQFSGGTPVPKRHRRAESAAALGQQVHQDLEGLDYGD